MNELDRKKAEVLQGNPRAILPGQMVDAKHDKALDVHKLPEWVKCFKCGKPPIGTNWLKPVSNDFNCKKMIHLDCIQKGLSKMFDRMGMRA